MFLLFHVLQIDAAHYCCWFQTGMVISKSIKIFIQEKLIKEIRTDSEDEMNCRAARIKLQVVTYIYVANEKSATWTFPLDPSFLSNWLSESIATIVSVVKIVMSV